MKMKQFFQQFFYLPMTVSPRTKPLMMPSATHKLTIKILKGFFFGFSANNTINIIKFPDNYSKKK